MVQAVLDIINKVIASTEYRVRIFCRRAVGGLADTRADSEKLLCLIDFLAQKCKFLILWKDAFEEQCHSSDAMKIDHIWQKKTPDLYRPL